MLVRALHSAARAKGFELEVGLASNAVFKKIRVPMQPLALEWLKALVVVGFMFGVLFSLVRELFRRLVFSTVLFLLTY